MPPPTMAKLAETATGARVKHVAHNQYQPHINKRSSDSSLTQSLICPDPRGQRPQGFLNFAFYKQKLVYMIRMPVSLTYLLTYLTRAPLGYSAERAPLGGGQILPPLPNSRTDGRRKTGKTANESSQQDES